MSAGKRALGAWGGDVRELARALREGEPGTEELQASEVHALKTAGYDSQTGNLIKEFDGVLWPWMSDSDASLPWVERDDESDRFKDDIEAAEHISKLTGMPIMFAVAPGKALGGGMAGVLFNLRPFVFPCLDSSMDDAYDKDGFEVWQSQVSERFGSRREHYDEALGITRLPVGTRVRVTQESYEKAFRGQAGEVSGLEGVGRWVVLDSRAEGYLFNCNQLEKEN